MIELIVLDSSTVDLPLENADLVLAPEELKYYETLRADSRRREFLLGRILLKTVLTSGDPHRVCDFCKISTTTSMTGKPAVSGAEFNLSHDGNAVLLAIGDQVVGVDIERVQDFDTAMIDLCFTCREQDRIAQSIHPDRVATLLWCLKEAAAKATGVGLLSGMRETGKRQLFFRGGFLTVAGLNRAYAVCSTQQISSMRISLALPRFEKVFNTFQFEDDRIKLSSAAAQIRRSRVLPLSTII